MMAYCESCQQKWRVKDVFLLGFSKAGKACPHCGNTQYIAVETKRLFTLGYLSLLFIPLFIFFIRLSNRDESM